MRSVAVFGGTGFLGRAVVGQLVAAGMTARVAVRHPEPIKLSDGTAQAVQVSFVYADIADEKSVGRALEGCDAAVTLVHMSGIGVDLNSQSSYVRSRARGELLVSEFPAATILRPSVLFGPEDKFLNTLITVAQRSPVLVLFVRR